MHTDPFTSDCPAPVAAAESQPQPTPTPISQATSKRGTPPQETLVATLVDLPRIRVQLLKYEFGEDRHFLLRRMKWSVESLIKGSEIKLERDAARLLVDALGAALDAPTVDATKS